MALQTSFHLMLLSFLMLTFGSSFGLTAKAKPNQVLGSFYSQGKAKGIVIDRNLVAAVTTSSTRQREASGISSVIAERLSMLGVTLMATNKAAATDRILGLPFHFAGAQSAIGILTDEVIVRFDAQKALDSLKVVKGLRDFKSLHFGKGLILARFEDPMTALKAANQLHNTTGIVFAHPNFILPKDFRGAKVKSPKDEPHYSHQWHLQNDGRFGGNIGADIDINPAWLITQGSADIKIAVLDGGFEMTHPDLETAWSLNPGEIPDNGRDDDQNGYVDDVFGWNFYNESNAPGTGLYGDHGTAVAGLAGGRVNGIGMTGVCPQCGIIPVVVAWRVADDAAAFYYAKKRGAQIITNSWGYAVGTPTTDVVEEAISAAAENAIILFAMNNINQNDCIGDTPDISSLESVVAVSASSDLDLKVSFSAWGECMEFVSPSFESKRPGIATADLMGTRGYNNGRREGDLEDLDYTKTFSGTSAATPIAAGVFGLMLAVNKELNRDDAIALIITTADKVQPDKAAYDPNTGFSIKYGYGRINAAKAVRAAQVFRKYTKRKDQNKSPL